MATITLGKVPPAAAATLESVPAAVVLVDASGTPHFANARAQRLAKTVNIDAQAALATLLSQSAGASQAEGSAAGEDFLTCSTVNGNQVLVSRQWDKCCIDGLRIVTLHSAPKNIPVDKTEVDGDGEQPPSLELMRSDKLATVGQLAAGMAHEINNPICYIQSNLGTFQDYVNKLFGLLELGDDLLRSRQMTRDERIDAMEARKRAVDLPSIVADLPTLLAESREGVDRIRQITQNLRNFSRTDATIAYQLVDLQRVLTTTVNLVRSLSDKRLTFATHFDALPLINGNPTQLSQVFMNILINAKQATGPAGRIEIRAVHDKATGDVRVDIHDNGCGMNEDVLNHLFEPFFTTKRVGIGTGLGLSISYKIIRDHCGHIDVHSTVGKGSTFHIVLPTDRAAADSQPTA